MARPKSWFKPREYSTAKKIARARSYGLWKYTRGTRKGATETGYYVGNQLPVRLKNARVEQKGV